VRPLDTIIIHCSATPEGRDVSADDIRSWHKARGWRDIGYHFVVNIDGFLQMGRPIEQIGAHAKGYNRKSIGICYIGGTDADLNAKDTLNEKQRETIQALIIDLKRSYPTITKLIGHNEVSAKTCPNFVVNEKFTL